MIRPRAFTLIELLVVVAVLAILAAIALPNFLEAQVRAKVSTVRSDLRTLSIGIEAYSTDYAKPLFDGLPGFAHRGWATSLARMTTPVAYLTTLPTDPFQDSQLNDSTVPGETHYLNGRHSYDYSTASWEDLENNPTTAADWQRNMGNSRWKLSSAGPDTRFMNDGSFFGFRELYDPTNGTTSQGDLVRSAGAR